MSGPGFGASDLTPSSLTGEAVGIGVAVSASDPCLIFIIHGIGFKMYDLGFGVWGLGFEVWGLGFGV